MRSSARRRRLEQGQAAAQVQRAERSGQIASQAERRDTETFGSGAAVAHFCPRHAR